MHTCTNCTVEPTTNKEWVQLRQLIELPFLLCIHIIIAVILCWSQICLLHVSNTILSCVMLSPASHLDIHTVMAAEYKSYHNTHCIIHVLPFTFREHSSWSGSLHRSVCPRVCPHTTRGLHCGGVFEIRCVQAPLLQARVSTDWS